MMCQCWFINCNTGIMLLLDVDNGRGYAYMVVRGTWETSDPSSQFCCESKSSLTIKVYFLKNGVD